MRIESQSNVGRGLRSFSLPSMPPSGASDYCCLDVGDTGRFVERGGGVNGRCRRRRMVDLETEGNE